jgi:hypothetical protein
MGVYSTVDITREDCLQQIRIALEKAPNNTLATVLFDLIGDETLNNFSIVPQYTGHGREFGSSPESVQDAYQRGYNDGRSSME